MVPVQLQLSNFLSYGTDAPALDFEPFQVACLSGGNGQGKSALLDAMTWALWGEARKSSGNRKPDDELIRIGTRHMQVELVFDVEGERYRVVRSYQRSATGKTTSSDLEFHLYDPAAGGYRPLTGQNQRETQAHVERAVGLDYDTFINSAFLLQGRSDEFTKKRPSERKEILARILNLSRYEALAALARDRWRTAKHEAEQAERRIERLEEALVDAPAWKEEHAAVGEAIAQKKEALQALRAEEKKLTEALADLEAQAREAKRLEATLEALSQRVAGHDEDAAGFRKKIEAAEKLLAQEAEIRQRHDRYEALQEERDALDTKRELYRGVEKQIEARRSDLREAKSDVEKRLHKLEVERAGFEQSLAEIEGRLAQTASAREALAAAEQAREEVKEQQAVRARRAALKEKMDEAAQTLRTERDTLRAQAEALRAQIKKAEDGQPGALAARIEELEAAVQKRESLREEREEVREEGTELKGTISELGARLGARREALEKTEKQLALLQDADESTCPTCGAALTPARREEVEADQRRTAEALRAEIDEEEAALAERRAARKKLLARFAELGEELEARAEAPEQLAAAREKQRTAREQQAALAAQKEKAEALEAQLEAKNYGAETRRRWQALSEERAALDFDEAAYDKLQGQAAQVESCKARLQELEELRGRKEQLQKKTKEHAAAAEALRQQVDDGTAFGALQKQIQALEQQLADVGYDPARAQDVKEQLRALSGAGSRLKDLLNAQQNREEWRTGLERAEERAARARAEKADASKRREALRAALEDRSAMEEKQRETAAQRKAAEEALHTLQGKRGELSARLAQAKKDRAHLKESKGALQAARKERALYKHLRAAFGKNGIPSLIIEQTLPEIEERANRMLERLTDGRMHVGLETLKDKKSGGTKETLDINITDEQGVVRAYETYSGGEAFRVNFALRIALAQLLAERSGVRIRTLVIDEGFGTQDPEGIQSLVEAISEVQRDFDKIVVITHLERLKQAFPTRIEVEKDPALGSTFEVVGV